MSSRHHRRAARWRPRLRWVTAWGAAALLSAAVIVTAVHARTWRRQQAAEGFLQQAEQQENEQRWLEAAQSLDAYLGLRPEAADQRVRVARLYASGAQDAAGREQAIDRLYRALGVCQSGERFGLQRHLLKFLLAEERLLEAEMEAGRMIDVQPADAAALRVRSIALLRQYKRGSLDHRVSRSMPIVAWLDEARRANPADIELAGLTAAAYRDFELGVAGQSTVAQREQLANACLDELVQASAGDPQVYLARHRYRSRFGVGDADADLEEALRVSPSHPEALLAAASAAQRKATRLCERNAQSPRGLEEFSKAVEFYRRALATSESAAEPEVYLELGDALLALGQPANALDAWQQGLKHFPQAQALHGRLADAYLTANEPQKAEFCMNIIDDQLNRTLSSDQSFLSMKRDQCLRRGVLLMQQESPREAIVQFQRVITLQEQLGGRSRQTTLAWRQLGQALSTLSRWEESAAAFDYACFEEPQSAELWALAAQAHLKTQRIDLAVERAERAVRQAAKEQAETGRAPTAEALRALSNTLAMAQARSADSNASQLSMRQLHQRDWPSLPAVHRLFASVDSKNIEPHPSAFMRNLSLQGVLLISRVQALRGEYDLAEEMLSHFTDDRTSVEQAEIDRELVQYRLSRGDVTEAHSMLTNLVRESPDNQSLLQLAAEIDIEHEHRVQAEYEATLIP